MPINLIFPLSLMSLSILRYSSLTEGASLWQKGQYILNISIITTSALISGIVNESSPAIPKYCRCSTLLGVMSENWGKIPPTWGGRESALESPAGKKRIVIHTIKYLRVFPKLTILHCSIFLSMRSAGCSTDGLFVIGIRSDKCASFRSTFIF